MVNPQSMKMGTEQPKTKLTPNKLKKVRSEFMDKYFSSSDELSDDEDKINLRKQKINPLQQHPMIKLYDDDIIHDQNLVSTSKPGNYQLQSLRDVSLIDFSKLMISVDEQ
jgi:hypothetical protein